MLYRNLQHTDGAASSALGRKSRAESPSRRRGEKPSRRRTFRVQASGLSISSRDQPQRSAFWRTVRCSAKQSSTPPVSAATRRFSTAFSRQAILSMFSRIYASVKTMAMRATLPGKAASSSAGPSKGMCTPSKTTVWSFSSAVRATSRTIGQRRASMHASSSGVRSEKSGDFDRRSPILRRSSEKTAAPHRRARAAAKHDFPA